MYARRRFLGLSFFGVAAATVGRAAAQAPAPQPRVWVPIVSGNTPQQPTVQPTPQPTVQPTPVVQPGDAPILGVASGTVGEAYAWLVQRADASYTPYDLGSIVLAYQDHGARVGIDWFLAFAQMCHETGSITSWWSMRPRRNPAGIAVTGRTQLGLETAPPNGNWAWNGTQWCEGVSFPTWADHGVPAHLGRLLAYALPAGAGTPEQRAMIDVALGYRGLPSAFRGCAPTISGLDGRWAVPGVGYGQRIMALAERMRQAA